MRWIVNLETTLYLILKVLGDIIVGLCFCAKKVVQNPNRSIVDSKFLMMDIMEIWLRFRSQVRTWESFH